MIIPAYNAAPFLRDAIASVLAQTFQDLEVVVVDDGSDDGTGDIARAFGAPVRVIRGENSGPAGARNRGIRAARGRWIAFLDADDVWHPEILENQTAVLEAEPATGLVYTNCWNTDGRYLLPVRRTAQRTAYSGSVFLKLLRENFIITSTVMVRRECLQRVGGFDESLRISEDFDLWLRIARTVPVRFVSRPLACYRIRLHGAFDDLERRVAARRSILEKMVRETDPRLLPGRRALGEVQRAWWLHLGRLYLRRGDAPQARILFRVAGRTGGWLPRPCTWLLLSYLPDAIQRRIRESKRRDRTLPCALDVLREGPLLPAAGLRAE